MVCAVVQALGCVLFLLCFNEHPFEDSAKLRIINANFSIPQSDTTYTVFHELIRKCQNFLSVLTVQSLSPNESLLMLLVDSHCHVIAKSKLHMFE